MGSIPKQRYGSAQGAKVISKRQSKGLQDINEALEPDAVGERMGDRIGSSIRSVGEETRAVCYRKAERCCYCSSQGGHYEGNMVWRENVKKEEEEACLRRGGCGCAKCSAKCSA